MRKLRFERMENRKLLAADGVGASVEVVERNDTTTLEVTLPTNHVIVREVKKKIANPNGEGDSDGNQGADRQIIEGDSGNTLEITTPNGRRIIREVGKKSLVGSAPNENTPTVNGLVNRNGEVLLADGTVIETTNGEALLQAGQVAVEEEVIVTLTRESDPGHGQIKTGTINTMGGKR